MALDTLGYWCGEGEGHRCGYCQCETSSISTGIYLSFTNPHRYNCLIDMGWRRSGMYLYKPSMDKTCCPQYTIKCNALSFTISKSQKKVIKYFIDFLECSDHGCLPVMNNKHHAGNEQLEDRIPYIASSNCISKVNTLFEKSAPHENAMTEESITLDASLTHSSIPFKTAVQLKESKKKRDFRRLRKLKKIAKVQNLAWEELDTSVFGIQPNAFTLSDRLSRADKNNRLDVKLVRIDDNNPDSIFCKTFSLSHEVYKKYQISIHEDSESQCDEKHFRRFLCSPPFSEKREEKEYGGFHQQYYIDGKLVAVGVLDILPWCISSVYFYYDPDYSALSFGTLSALYEIRLTQQLNVKKPSIKWYYMGFYIHSCPKMKYKSKFSPSYLLCPKSYAWYPIEQCQDQLEENKFCVFNKDHTDSSEFNDEDLNSLKVLLDRRLCLYSVYKNISLVDEYKEILRLLVKLVGLENAQNICIYSQTDYTEAE